MKHPVLRIEHDNERGEQGVESQISSTTINTTVADDVPLTTTSDTFAMKLKSIPPLFSYMIPVGLVYLFEYFINQGLVSHHIYSQFDIRKEIRIFKNIMHLILFK